MAYNYSKLLGRITEKFGTQGNFAKSMNISERSLSLKLTNKVPFKQPEISKACQLLGISDKEIPAHFLLRKFNNIELPQKGGYGVRGNIDVDSIPEFQRNALADLTLELTRAYFEIPGMEERYQHWSGH